MKMTMPDPRADAWPDRDDLVGFENTEFYPAEFKEEDESIRAEMDRAYAEDMERDAKMRSRAEDYGIEL